MYKGKAANFLEGVEIGDRVRIEKDKRRFEGLLMPRTELADDSHIVIKLDSGYNIGVRVDETISLEVIERTQGAVSKVAKLVKDDPSLPSVSIIGTGGTIASKIDYKTGAVAPAFSTAELHAALPELSKMANIRTRMLFNVLSENMGPENWVAVAKAAAQELNNGAHGVVVAHGTDTMGYTAAALSFMLKGLSKPVVLVGSQRSSDRPSSDSAMNLIAAVKVASSNAAGVFVVMHGSVEDNYCLIHRGTKVRKMHSSRRDAFRSINVLPLGRVTDKVEFTEEVEKRGTGNVTVDEGFEPNVALIKIFPGMSEEVPDYYVDKYYGLVIEGTGLGHVPEKLLPSLEEAKKRGIPVVMTTQTLYGRVNMNVYATGRHLLEQGVIPGGDMLPETALVKLMYVLGQTKKPEEIKRLMETDLAGEISEVSRPDAFLG